MSFYGNVTNTSRTHFQFDRIYASRKEMESHKNEDGIYAGRFVLVEYDNQMHMDSFLRITKIENATEAGEYYAILENRTSTGSVEYQETKLTRGNIHKGTIVYTSAYETDSSNGYYAKNCIFYKCKSDYEENSNEPAIFEETVDGRQYIYVGKIDEYVFQENLFFIKNNTGGYDQAADWSASDQYYILSNYITNYTLDNKCYGRGYDSTVWQKVYVGGQEKYIMIAELNAIVPSFDIEADAPTQAPIAPHFDLESSDLYYKLHYQPSWGLRVKAANAEKGPGINQEGNEIENSIVDYSIEQAPLKSDEMTVWRREKYDPTSGETQPVYWHSIEKDGGSTGEWQLTPPIKPIGNAIDERTPAAIYYNKAGFSSDIHTIDAEVMDHITLTPSGQSGQIYNIHNGTTHSLDVAPDIQELSIMLPSLGNSVAKMWDIIYGEGEETSEGQKRNKNISWDSKDGLRLVHPGEDGYTYNYNTDEIETLAGAINSVHDLMGMIITETSEPVNPDSADKNRIYYYNNKFHMRYPSYSFTPIELIPEYVKVEITEEEFLNGTYYVEQSDGTYIEESTWNDSYEYHKKYNKVPGDMQYKEVDESQFEVFPPDTYFYGEKTITSNDVTIYHLETHDYPTYGYNYQASKDESKSLFNAISLIDYDKDLYFRIEDNIILREANGNKSEIKGKGYINGDESPNPQLEYSKIEIIPIDAYIDSDGQYPFKGKKPYLSTAYYVLLDRDPDGNVITKMIEPGTNPSSLKLARDAEVNDGLLYNDNNYYYLPHITEDNDLLFDLQPTFQLSDNEYYNKIFYSTDEYTSSDSKLHKLIGCYQPGTEIIDPNLQEILFDENFKFFILNDIEETKTKHFYRPGMYYQITRSEERDNLENPLPVEYTLSMENEPNEEQYYEILNNNDIKFINLDPASNETPKYYVSDSYYYQLDNGEYIIDTNNKITKDRDYFIRENVFYVYDDTNKYFGRGAEWNPNIQIIPESVTLATREPLATMEELVGFADTLNTIHGLILNINNILLKNNDIYTRDSTTVRGCINLMNDILQRFEIISPGQIMVVDDYGRLHSAPMTGDNWIDINIDDNAVEPIINISHKIIPVDNTESNTDQSIIGSSGEISLYTPYIDDTGHIVGRNIETIELPYGFKTFVPEIRYVNDTTGERTEDKQGNKAYKAPFSANNHIDELVLKTGPLSLNWEYLPDGDTDDSRKTLCIKHIKPVPVEEETKTLNFGTSYLLEDLLAIDETGHISSADKRSIKLQSFTKDENSKAFVTNINSEGILETLDVIDLPLTGYSKLSSTEISPLNTNNGKTVFKAIKNDKKRIILETDSVRDALAKLESAIYALQDKHNLS